MQINMSFGTVTTVNTWNRTAQVVLDDGQLSNKNYKYPKGSTPANGDRVLICNNAIVAIY